MKIKKFFSLALVFVLALVLVACGGGDNTSKTDYNSLLNSYLLNLDNVLTADFTLDSTLKVGENTYDLKWTSSDACISIASTAVDGTYTATVTRPDTKKEVTLTVTLGDATKSFTFQVNPYDVYDFTGAYVFAQDKAIVAADFDLDTEFTKWGKTATIAWESLNENLVKISEDGKKAQVTPTSAKTDVTLKAKFTYNGEESVVRYTVTVFEEMDSMESINYWYTNTGVAQTLSGYVISIATAYSETYGNVSFYMVDDSLKAGYYIFRGLCDATMAAKIVPGAHVTVTGATNTVYNGLYETNASTGTVVIDEDVASIDINTTVYDFDNDLISGTPAAIYRQSSLVKLNGWKITAKLAEPTRGATTSVLTVERDGVSINLLVSKYNEGYFSPWAADADPKFDAIVAKYNDLAVGDYIDVTGILGNYNGHQIAIVSADLLVKSTDKGESAGKALANAIAAVEIPAKISENTTIDLPAGEAPVAITWKLAKSSDVAKVENGKLVVTLGEAEASFTLIGTYTNGDYSTSVYYTSKVAVLDNSIKTIADAKALEAGTETTIQGTVMAVNTKGYILYDGTDAVYVYAAGATEATEQTIVWAVGDTVKVEGKLDAYKGLIEYIPTKSSKVEITESAAPAVKSYATTEIQAYVAASATSYAQDYVQFTGTLTISGGKYYNIAIEGLETEQVSISAPTEAFAAMLAELDGKEITISGYAIGQSSNTYLNVMLTSIDSTLTIKAAKLAPTGTVITVEGQVVAASTRGYVVYDGTDAIYVYAKGSSVADLQTVCYFEEDQIVVTGTKDFYNGDELIPTFVSYAEEEKTYDQGKAAVYTATEVAAYVSADATSYPNKLVEVTGTVEITESGYYNVKFEGAESATVSLSYLSDEQKLEYANGESYTIYGYTIGHTSNTYMNIIPCSYLAPLEPYVEVYKEGALYCNPEFTAENCSWGGHQLTFGVDGFADIKEAIAAAEDGDEIYLQSGEYVLQDSSAASNFVLNKHLKFYGPNAEISGNAKQRHAEATIIQSSGTNAISYSNLLEFYGVEFYGKGIGFISHDYFLAVDGAKGIILKNCLANNITSFLKVKDKAYGNYVVEDCYFHGINQFIVWMTGGTLVFVNNTIDGEDCGGVTNAAGSAFRFRGAVIAKIYHNNFIGDYNGYPGYFEPNAVSGGAGLLDIQYNNFNCVENFYLNNTVSGCDLRAFMNNNIYTDGMNEAGEIPATIDTTAMPGITTDTNTFESVEALEEAWAALGFKWAVVSFDANGGSEADTALYYDFATAVLPTTAREGYEFDGWYNGDTKVETLTEAGVYTLTAKWNKIYTEVYKEGALYVNPAFTAENCTWGGETLTFGTNGFADIKSAIAAATEGQEIYLQAGEYVFVADSDSANYVLNKNVKIYGTNKGVAGDSDDRYPESVIYSGRNHNTVLASFVEFDGVEFKGPGTGYISHDYFTATTGATGMTIKNSIVDNITSFLKVKDVTSGDYLVDSCYIHNINQFFAWLNGGNLTFVNNYYDGANCGGVENSGGSSFRVRGVSNIEIFHNTFVGNNNYTGWFEPNCASGETGKFVIEYNTFLGTTNFFLSTSQSSVTLKATMNNNFYADANGVATAIPENVTGGIATVTADTTTYASQELVDAAWNNSEYNDDKVTYTITYDVAGGTEIEPATYTDYAKVTLATPVKDGYEFLGWYNGENKVEALTENGDITLTASWAKLYTITYDYNGGTISGTPLDIKFFGNASNYFTGESGVYTYHADSVWLLSKAAGQYDSSSTYSFSYRIGLSYDANTKLFTVVTVYPANGSVALSTIAEDYVIMANGSYANFAAFNALKAGDNLQLSVDLATLTEAGAVDYKLTQIETGKVVTTSTLPYTELLAGLTKGEQILEGWYVGENKVTEITTAENITLVAHYVDKPTGLIYKTVEELAAAYMADWNAATHLSLTAATLDTASCDSSTMTTALQNAEMNTKWAWLYAAINTVTGDADKAIGTADVTTSAVKGYYFANLCGLFTQTQHTDTYLSTTSADWTVTANVANVLNAGPTYED